MSLTFQALTYSHLFVPYSLKVVTPLPDLMAMVATSLLMAEGTSVTFKMDFITEKASCMLKMDILR